MRYGRHEEIFSGKAGCSGIFVAGNGFYPGGESVSAIQFRYDLDTG
ncbi:hypothetical protein DET0107 [Dehalococcoides mccartyi 195]|uniref:Uncharacterized protein n=1 Tax=Dehalococcoides mccartyi (strain ATCC BAA-2266 / KCTC 15142 / 195) TaxID=243164 RepID=Q3ZA91_DEHM1|nr:hypothetical protein DET0107 [Dehalococcoides mccartyi 195]